MRRHWGVERPSSLRVARIVEGTEVLGPGKRAAVLVQGCHLRCRGCVAEPTHPLDGGTLVAVDDLAVRLGALPGVTGITFSGGEPFLQAAALVRLVDLLRGEDLQLSVMSFSGYRLEWLRSSGSASQQELLRRLDLLVDGPYVERLHAPLLWRGSRNQRLHALSPRHRADLERRSDGSAGMEWSIDPELRFEWVGVPPVPGFVRRLTGETSEANEREVVGI